MCCHNIFVRCYGYTAIFPNSFTKGDNFCDFRFASLDDIVLPIGVNS